MTDPLLSVFPPPLLRRILCGGGGLAEAWGPLADLDGACVAWNPYRVEVFDPGPWSTESPIKTPDLWRLPLDHWRARLGLVAARMLRPRGVLVGGAIYAADPAKFNSISVSAFLMDDAWPTTIRWNWSRSGLSHDNIRTLNLPTLPAHLTTHDPAVALVRALYDVPEIRARIAP